jgi:hypothetical protein
MIESRAYGRGRSESGEAGKQQAVASSRCRPLAADSIRQHGVEICGCTRLATVEPGDRQTSIGFSDRLFLKFALVVVPPGIILLPKP